jgi:23S rRNA (pseudouridine1915-N3)-methyltransferase
VPVTDKSPAGRHLIQKKEAELLKGRLSKTLSPRGAYYILDEGGKILSTQMWAKQIKEWQTEGVTEIVFCVGSSMGFDESIKSGARGIFSLGAQTLSHDLARAVLLEQLYRAMSVVRGHPYHNEG